MLKTAIPAYYLPAIVLSVSFAIYNHCILNILICKYIAITENTNLKAWFIPMYIHKI